ncbi:hypothetical protein LY76DRAFT_88440 [Colletotrichum caudatum]|nr:hypothetical protein LY76DRAFT_88440 [Colletotrichum caudatum]
MYLSPASSSPRHSGSPRPHLVRCEHTATGPLLIFLSGISWVCLGVGRVWLTRLTISPWLST